MSLLETLKQPWHALSKDEVFKLLQANQKGLSQEEVKNRLKIFGPNAIPESRRFRLLTIFLFQWKSPVTLLLAMAAVFSFSLHAIPDAIMMTVALSVSVIFGFLEEARSENALKKLKDTLKRFALVIRAGEKSQTPIEQIVPGDVVILREGDVAPADARILESADLEMDESALTGESLPVSKHSKLVAKDAALAERSSLIFKGTIVASGDCQALVVATGEHTQFGRIAQDIAKVVETQTPLQKAVSGLAKRITLILIVLFILLVALGLFRGQSTTAIILISVAAIASAIPEGMPIALTSVLAVGMIRLLKQNALVKKLVAAETLGSVTVICSDKTGTLTSGNMSLSSLFTLESKSIPIAHELMALGVSAKFEADGNHKNAIQGPPTERALLKAAADAGLEDKILNRDHLVIKDFPFSPGKRYRATVFQDQKTVWLSVIGAPESVLEKCSHLSPKELAKISDVENQAAKKHKRVIALARRSLPNAQVEHNNLARDLEFVALAILEDPLREEAVQAIKKTREAGTRFIMITGDHPETAKAIALQAGVYQPENVLTGADLENLSDTLLDRAVATCNVFARSTPSTKIKIIESLQRRGEVVAMIGDGINDAPALKLADIGVAMGSAQDVSKETADIILLDNNLGTLVVAIQEGRRIFDNIQRSIFFLLYGSYTEVFILTTCLIFGLPLPLVAAQILWVKLIEDVLPSFAFTFEPAEEDVMQLKPRGQNDNIFSRRLWEVLFIFGMTHNLWLFLLYLYVLPQFPIETVRTFIFLGIGLDSFVTVFTLKSFRKNIWHIKLFSNPWLLGALAVGGALYFVAIFSTPIREFLSLGVIPLRSAWLLLILCGTYLVSFEFVKWFFLLRGNKKTTSG
ncbi:MAG: cation-transporting P-type ATPase [bacterium]